MMERAIVEAAGDRPVPPASARPPALLKNIGSTWLLNLLQILVMLALVPFVIARLGKDQNGVWVTIVAFTDYWKLLIAGVPMASVRFVAGAVARRDLAGTNRAISTCLGIGIALGGVALAVASASYLFFDARYLGGALGESLSRSEIDGARIAFAIVALQVVFGFAMRLPYAVFDAHGDFVLRNLIMAGELALRAALTFWWLDRSPTLPTFATILGVCMVAEFVATLVVIRARYPGVRFGLGAFDRTLVREVFGFSVFAMLLNAGALLAFRSDALVIGAFLPAAEATNFDNGNKFFDPLMQLVISVGAVMMPMATRLSAGGDVAELEHVFLRWSKICFSIALLVGLYLLVLGPEFLGAWLGPEYAGPSGEVLQVLMASFLFYLPVRGVALPLLMGLGKPRAPAIAMLAMGVLNVAISLALVRPMGIAGVAIGTAIPNVLFAIAIAVLACRELGVAPREFLAYVAGRPLVGALVPLAFLLWVRYGLRAAEIEELVAAGVVMVAIFAVVWTSFVYRGDPHVDVRGGLARAFGVMRRKTP